VCDTSETFRDNRSNLQLHQPYHRLLHDGQQISFPQIVQSVVLTIHTHLALKLKKSKAIYLYSPALPSRQVIRWILPSVTLTAKRMELHHRKFFPYFTIIFHTLPPTVEHGDWNNVQHILCTSCMCDTFKHSLCLLQQYIKDIGRCRQLENRFTYVHFITEMHTASNDNNVHPFVQNRTYYHSKQLTGAGLAHQPQIKHSPCLWLTPASQVFNYSVYLLHALQSHTKMIFGIHQANTDWHYIKY